MAWARRNDEERQLRGGDDNYGNGGRATTCSEVGVGIDDNYREVTTTTGAGDRRRRGARWGVGIDDKYGGGDDNYPRAVVKMGAEGREEGRGRNRQK